MAEKSSRTAQVQARPSTVGGAVEILLLLAIALNFSFWGTYAGVPARLLGLFACVYCLNNWLTTRSSFDFYSGPMFATDLLIVFMSMNLPASLARSSGAWGYAPSFWLLIGGMELVDVLWDIEVMAVSPESGNRRELWAWAVATAVVTVACFGLYWFLRTSRNIQQGNLAAALLTIILLTMTLKWNWDRFFRMRKAGARFLDS